MSNPEIAEQTAQLHTGEVLPPEPDPRALNSVRHGMGSEHVPPGERAGYAAHVQAVRASSGARGYLQERLADRAALALWRLDRVARYEAAAASMAQRKALQAIEQGEKYGPAEHVTAAYDRLHRLTWEPVEQLRADPTLSEREAQRFEGYAGTLDTWAAGGEGRGLSEEEAGHLGELLAESLQALKVPPAQMVRAMLGRAPKRGEADSVESEEWTYEPAEVPGLLRLYRERLGDLQAYMLRNLAGAQRLKAQAIRDAQREAEHAQADALAVSALPHAKELEKVTRYEAHLERVLYRALHDLEAARREAAGQDTPGPLRGILDALSEPKG